MSARGALQDFPIVHAVTDSSAVARDSFPDRAAAIMHALGPRGALHLRSARSSGRRLYDLAEALAHVQEESGCWLILNDRIDIAAGVGARGIQLASHSLEVGDALAAAAGIPVGASVHSVSEAVEAEASGASWCVAGTIFATPSHPGRPPARIEFVEAVARAVTIPVIAIGGVRPENVPALVRAGAWGVATIRGAGWTHGFDAAGERDNLLQTRLPVTFDRGSPEPVTRYISEYDSVTGVERDDNAHGERSSEGAGAE